MELHTLYAELVAQGACTGGAAYGVSLYEDYAHPPLAPNLAGLRCFLAGMSEDDLDTIMQDEALDGTEVQEWAYKLSGHQDKRLEEYEECTLVGTPEIPYSGRDVVGPVWRISVPHVGDLYGQDYSMVRQSNAEVLDALLGCSGNSCHYHNGAGEFYVSASCADVHVLLGALESLESYPLLDDEHHSQLEWKTAEDAWADWGEREWALEVCASVSEALRDWCEENARALHGELDPDMSGLEECAFVFDTDFSRDELAAAVRAVRRETESDACKRWRWHLEASQAVLLADHWRQHEPSDGRPLPEYVTRFLPIVLDSGSNVDKVSS